MEAEEAMERIGTVLDTYFRGDGSEVWAITRVAQIRGEYEVAK